LARSSPPWSHEADPTPRKPTRATNVIPFAVRAEINPALSAVASGRTAASVVADLVSTVEQIRDISERVLPLPYDARDVERTIQALLDAISAIEHATDVLTNHGERTPF
jgi:hypothetical protein